MKMGMGLYLKNSVEAVELYKEAFGLELGYHVLNPDGSYFHSELCRDSQEMFDVIESPREGSSDDLVQVSIILDSNEDVQRAYALLSREGVVETPIGPLPWSPCAATLKDKFGVWWYISSPQHYPPENYDPTASWETGMYKKPE